VDLEERVFRALQKVNEGSDSLFASGWSDDELHELAHQVLTEHLAISGRECFFCRNAIAAEDEAWEQVTAWIGGKKKDGATLRQKTGLRAHGPCVRKERSGQAPDQDTVFDESPAEPARVVGDDVLDI
jgi:hypothetical protein